MSGYCGELPSERVRDNLRRMINRWNAPIGQAVRDYGWAAWPGVPLPQLLALSDNSISGREAISLAGFWEVGFYQVPAGDPSQPATSGGSYFEIANSQACVDILGRPAVTGRGWADDIPGQAVVGILNFKDEGVRVVRSIPASVRPVDPSSPWAVAVNIYGYVRSTGAIQAINEYATQLAEYDEKQRPAALAWLVAKRFADGGALDSGMAYPIKRSLDRLLLGRALAESVGEDTSWWPDFGPSMPGIEHWLTLAKYGQPTTACSSMVQTYVEIGPNKTSGGSMIASIIAASLVVGAVGYIAYQRGWLDRILPLARLS